MRHENRHVCVCNLPESLLRFCAVWNTNARNCLHAQAVIQVLLTHLSPEELLTFQGARAHLEGLIPYTGGPQTPNGTFDYIITAVLLHKFIIDRPLASAFLVS